MVKLQDTPYYTASTSTTERQQQAIAQVKQPDASTPSRVCTHG